MKELYITRHGETEYNRLGRVQGRLDIELNEQGKSQAMTMRSFFTRKNIAFDRVYSSPLKRAVETAEIITSGNEITVDNRLIEFDFGALDGMDINSFLVTQQSWDLKKDQPRFPGGESNKDLIDRVSSFMEDIKNTEFDRALIVSHGRTIKAIIGWLCCWENESLWKQRFPIGTLIHATINYGEVTSIERMSLL